MKSAKLCFLLVVSAVLVFSVDPRCSHRNTISIQQADGGSPMPPIPPPGPMSAPAAAARVILQADGGSPMPPIPPKRFVLAARPHQSLA